MIDGMDQDEAVAAVTRLGLELAAENTERLCPACGSIMRWTVDLLGVGRWTCRRCGLSST